MSNDESNEDGSMNKNGRLFKSQNGDDDRNGISSATGLKMHQRHAGNKHTITAIFHTQTSVLVLSSLILLFACDFLLLPVLSVYKKWMTQKLFPRISL